MTQLFGVLFALVLVAGFATSLIVAVRRQRQRMAEKTQILAGLGYEVIDTPDPAFVERVTRLRTRWGHEQYRVRFCAVRKSWEYTSYVLDLWRRSGKNTRLAGENTMAFVSSRQQFPRFSLAPRPKLPGFISGFVDTFTEKLLTQHGGKVEFPEDPSFADNCIVAGKDRDAIRKVLTPHMRDYVAANNRFHLEAGGDMVLISTAQFDRGSATPPQDSLLRSVSEATALFERLRGR